MKLHTCLLLARGLRGVGTLLLCAAATLAAGVTASSKDALAQLNIGNAVREFRPWQTAGLTRDAATDIHWVGLRRKLGPEWKDLEALGVKYLGFCRKVGPVYIYKMDFAGVYDAAVERLKALPSFVNALPLQQAEKLSRGLWLGEVAEDIYADARHSQVRIDVSFYDKATASRAARLLAPYVDSIIFVQPDMPYHAAVVAPLTRCRAIAALPEVAGVAEFRVPQLCMPEVRRMALVDSAQRFDIDSITLPPTTTTVWTTRAADTLTGKGVTVGVYDVGLDTGVDAHPDFCEMSGGNSVPRLDSTWMVAGAGGNAYHGTMVAGIAAGNGWRSSLDSTHSPRYAWRGVAPQSSIYASSINSYSGHYGDVSNHSGTDGSPGQGAFYYNYSPTSYQSHAAIDKALSYHDTTSRAQGGNDNNVIVYSGDNTGDTRGYYSASAAKNSIRTQFVDKYTNGHHTYNSSLGPTYDGRLGFDVVAPIGRPDLFERWDIEIDYIRVVCDTDTAAWEFNDTKNAACDSLYWGCDTAGPGYSTLRRGSGGGSIAFGMQGAGWGRIWSDSTSFPNDTTARLVMRYRISDSVAVAPFEKGYEHLITAGVFWRNNPIAGGNPWWQSHVQFYAHVNAGWQTAVIPLRHTHQMSNVETYTYGFPEWITQAFGPVHRFGIGFACFGPLTAGLQAVRSKRIYGYQHYVGTSSNAAPVVTGAIALMLQKYQDRILPNAGRGWPGKDVHDRPFWNSTARAILIHTATDLVDTVRHATDTCIDNPEYSALGAYPSAVTDTIEPLYGPGPDWVTGWGLLNTEKACAYVDTNKFREDTVADNGLLYYTMHVPPSTQKMRVSMVWDDPPPWGVQDAANAFECKLVNELDLYLVPPSGDTVYRPYVLDDSHMKGRTVPNWTGPVAYIDSSFYDGAYRIGISPDTVLAYPAKPGINRIDNVEVVDVTSPDTGQWLVVVQGYDVPENQSLAGQAWHTMQDLSLVSDLTCAKAQAGPDTLGLAFGYGNVQHAQTTTQGYLRLEGDTGTGSPAGLRFVGASTTVSLDTTGHLQCTDLQQNQGSWLGVQNNLLGGLVWRNPNGVVAAHISAGGTVRLRKALQSGMGPL